MERKLREALLDAPDMFSFRDEDALIYFQNVRRLNPESPVLRFAINWARLMEKELKERGARQRNYRTVRKISQHSRKFRVYTRMGNNRPHRILGIRVQIFDFS